jgi:hypothetical protein
MTDMILDREIELTPDKLEDYLVAAASVVEELQSFLGSHYEELIKCHMEIHGRGIAVDMPIAAQDPQYAAHIHKLKNACDAFVNVMRNNY